MAHPFDNDLNVGFESPSSDVGYRLVTRVLALCGEQTVALSNERIVRYRGTAEDEYGAVTTVVCPLAAVLYDDDSVVLDDVVLFQNTA